MDILSSVWMINPKIRTFSSSFPMEISKAFGVMSTWVIAINWIPQ